MVSIPSIHFFRWVSQLQDSGYEVYWFDITGMSKHSDRINWVSQQTNWKMKWDFLGRTFLKVKFPVVYKSIQKINEKDVAKEFEKYLFQVQPDIVHSFALQLSCLPILNVMNENPKIKWAFSSWGSDIFYSKQIGINDNDLRKCFKRIDYLITDCTRDFNIATEKGFRKIFLGVFPGNGGVDFFTAKISPVEERKIILIKGYNDKIGRGLNIVKALDQELIALLKEYEVIIFGADELIKKYIEENSNFKKLKFTIYLKKDFIPNADLISLMGKSLIYVANSLSDGIPNSLIEAMGMGAFPIQSNPGKVTEEIIEHGRNGFLIDDPENLYEIKKSIIAVLKNEKMIKDALKYNKENVRDKYNRQKVKKQILNLYEEIAC